MINKSDNIRYWVVTNASVNFRQFPSFDNVFQLSRKIFKRKKYLKVVPWSRPFSKFNMYRISKEGLQQTASSIGKPLTIPY